MRDATARFASLAAALSMLVGGTAAGQGSDDATRPEVSTHAVGFRVIETFDRARGYGDPGSDRRRPLQVACWYPAVHAADAPRMPYGAYLDLTVGRDDFDGTTDEERRATSLRVAARRVAKYGADVAPEAWLALPTAAVRDAAAAEGTFPLVLYAPGFSQPSFDNSLVCELLAKHGFVVLAAPSAGARSQSMTEDLRGIEAQVRDLEFLVALAHELPGCDPDRVGAFGWSWGAIAVVLQQMRNPYIDAVVSYDGSLPWNAELVRSAIDYDPARLTVPYLYACQGGMEAQPLALFEQLEPERATLLRFHRMSHGEFGSYRPVLRHGLPDAFDYDTTSYDALARYTLHFFAAHLRDAERSHAFLARTPAENGVSDELLTRE